MKSTAARFLTALLVMGASVTATAQTTPTDTTATAPKPETEVHEGMWGVVSYFGSKLVDELATRLNLSEEDSTQTKVPTTVVVKVGSIGFTRTEMRAAEPKR